MFIDNCIFSVTSTTIRNPSYFFTFFTNFKGKENIFIFEKTKSKICVCRRNSVYSNINK